MKRPVTGVCSAFLIVILFFPSAWAQGTAQISGAVRDTSGAVLPGVEITATQTETGIVRTTVSNETGSYVLSNLPLGPYRLEAALPGFRTFVQTGIVLQVNASPVINPTLEVGQVSEQVEVQANATMVETRNVGVGQVIENSRIMELPLNGRQVTDLIVLAGAAVQTGTSSDLGMSPYITPTLAVAGGLSTATAFFLDGAFYNDPFNNLSLPLPFPDALQEFKVETSALSALNGIYSGAAINSVTKSGTNTFHGDLFEFVRNDLFNARNYFATKSSTLKRNQFGGTAGGAIVKNKVFAFGGYQGTTLRQDPANNITFVPTAAMMAGDFMAFSSPACNRGRQINLAAPFANNRIDPSLFSKAAVNIASKLPQTFDPCGRITFGQRTVLNEGEFVGRIDYQRNTNHSVFSRLLFDHFNQSVPYTLDLNLLNTTAQGWDNLAQSYALGDTYLIGPNMVNSYRLAVNRTAVNRATAKFFSAPDVGVNAYSYAPHEMYLNVTGGPTLGATYGPNRTTSYLTSDDFSIVHGTHQIAFGGIVAHWRNNNNSDQYSPGVYNFTGQVTGLGMADFLTGKLTSIQQAANNTNYISQWYFGLYAADSWKMRPRLTVNYGLRWEPGFPQIVRTGMVDNFDEAKYAAGIRSTVFHNAPYGFTYAGDPGFPAASCRKSGICNAGGIYTQWRDLSPHLGFAWDPRGDGRTSIRSSYALSYDLRILSFLHTFTSQPWNTNIQVTSPAGGFDNPWTGYPGGNPFPPKPIGPDTAFQPFANYFSIPRDSPMTSRHTWNLGIQRQIGNDWLVSTTYLGSHTVHVWGDRELNPAIYIPGGPCTLQGVTYNPCSTTANENARRRLALLYPNVGGTTMAFLGQYEGGGTQSYEGLLLSVQRRAQKGVVIGGNYTLSHCWGNITQSNQKGGNAGQTYLNPDNRAFDRGNCESDRRQIFNLTAVAETPRFVGPMLRAFASGWKLSGIYRYSTGSFLTITSGVDRQLSGVNSQRAQQIFGNPFGNKSLADYLNAKAFALPALGTLGNMGPRNIVGPNTWQFDTALSRVFQLRESQRLELRVEAYNLTNSLRPGNPNTNFNSGTFGQITTALDPRILQFAAKYVF